MFMFVLQAQDKRNTFANAASRLGISTKFGIYEDTSTDHKNSCRLCGINPNIVVIRYLNWAFRHSFTVVVISMAGLFFVWTAFFAAIIYAIGMQKPNCIHVNGIDFGANETSAGERVLDAYALSWTTFSTVVSTFRYLAFRIAAFPSEANLLLAC